jgi:uncharacterized phiE125 gp8 family phage protein
MAIRLSGPEPIATPGDVPGDHASGDTAIAAIISAVQASIDGPTGWLGRSLGKQTLALSLDSFCRSMRLPYEPVSEITSVVYRASDGAEVTIEGTNYRLVDGNRFVFGTGFAFPETECGPGAVTITFEAGYEADEVPPNAKQAVIIGVQHLKALTEQSVFVRSEEVDGIGTETFAVSEAGANVVKAATEALLMPLRVYSL